MADGIKLLRSVAPRESVPKQELGNEGNLWFVVPERAKNRTGRSEAHLVRRPFGFFDAGDHFLSVFPACCQDLVTFVPSLGPDIRSSAWSWGGGQSRFWMPMIAIGLCLHKLPGQSGRRPETHRSGVPKIFRSTIGGRVAPQAHSGPKSGRCGEDWKAFAARQLASRTQDDWPKAAAPRPEERYCALRLRTTSARSTPPTWKSRS